MATDLQLADDRVQVVEHLVDPAEQSGGALALAQVLPAAHLRHLLQLTWDKRPVLRKGAIL